MTANLAVRLGLGQEAWVTLGWFPGDRAARVLQIRNEAGDLPNSKALSEMVDLTLARSGEQFSIPDALIVLARWGHFTDLGLPWENAITL